MLKNLNRQQKGIVLSAISLIINLILAVLKLLIYIYTNSIMILGDSFNNFGDSISNIGNIYGFSTSNKKPSKKHPFGYERIEYIFTILTAFIVVTISIMYFKNALERFFILVPIQYRQRWFYVMVATSFVKLGLALFYKVENYKINSPVVKAMYFDAIQDTFISLLTAFSYKWSGISSIPIDAILGITLAFYIMIQSIILIVSMTRLLIGDNSHSSYAYIYSNLTLENSIYYFNNIKIHHYSNSIIYATVDIYNQSGVLKNEEKNAMEKLKKQFKIEQNIHLYYNVIKTEESIENKELHDILFLLYLEKLFYNTEINNNTVTIEALVKDVHNDNKIRKKLNNLNLQNINYQIKYFN